VIYCCGCQREVEARLTDGREIYPHRPDLADLPFWRCDTCKCYVGCHWKTKNRTRPLGNIPTAAIRNGRQHIHKLLDPLWQGGRRTRGSVYGELSGLIGYPYHTGEIKSVEEAREIYRCIQKMKEKADAAMGN